MTEIRRSQRNRKATPKATAISASTPPTKPSTAAPLPTTIPPAISETSAGPPSSPLSSPSTTTPKASPPPKRLPRTIQRKPSKIVKHPKKSPPYQGPQGLFEMAGLGDQAIRKDFRSMGMLSDRIMATKEPEVDATGCPIRPTIAEKKDEMAVTQARFQQKLNRRKSSPNRKHQEIYPWPENKHWVLFNHTKGWPPLADIPEPKEGSVWDRLKVYEPGNKKIVVFNIVSGNIGLRSTPEWMVEKEIVYAKSGVRVVKVKREK